MDTSLGPKTSPLVAEWQMRLEDLRAQLRLQPEHPKAWQWRLEEKVLVFMLARYSALATLNPLPASPPLFIVHGALVGRVKQRQLHLRVRQLLNDIRVKNHQTREEPVNDYQALNSAFEDLKETLSNVFMDVYFKAGDHYSQNEIYAERNRELKRRKQGYD